jgi:hypothetical protein
MNMSETNEPTSSNLPAQAEPKRVTRLRVSQERLDRYIEVLELTGSHFEASRLSSAPNEVQPVSERSGGTTPPPGYQTFYMERKTSPEFARRCEEAINNFVGRAESELARRMFLPTERATIDKNGVVQHISRDYRNADLLLVRALSRHRPEWVDQQKRSVESNISVTHNGNGAPGGIGFVITPQLTSHLNDEEKRVLSDLMRKMVECSEAAEKEKQNQLPAPNNEPETP